MDSKANSQSSTLLEELNPKRRNNPEANPGEPASSSNGNETIISGDTVFEGKVLAQAELRVDGTFKGEITSSSRVIVGTAGKVEATVEAKSMVVSGCVVGNLMVHERLEILSTGEVYGDLETQPGALIIEKGARLEGRCSMGLDTEKAREKKGGQPRPQAQQANSGSGSGAGGKQGE